MVAAGDATKHEGTISEAFDEIAAAYRAECAAGIPMSVHERYERRLTSLRAELRSTPTQRMLGDVLRSMEVVDDQQLADALRAQAAGGGAKLLGEILIDLGWATEQAIRQAVERQSAARRESAAGLGGASGE
ncbi:MAG: hypothetical protein PHW86_06480 [Candidatus Bipolaricaulis sp.]|nr:hypothetical protein [Candidatus Bipolaricaulis sp.]